MYEPRGRDSRRQIAGPTPGLQKLAVSSLYAAAFAHNHLTVRHEIVTATRQDIQRRREQMTEAFNHAREEHLAVRKVR